MRYRHCRHAGNHGDVLKHIALLAQLDNFLLQQEKILFVDTHAGSGMYSASEKSERCGIGRVLLHFATSSHQHHSGEIEAYLTAIRSFRKGGSKKGSKRAYPGSPILAALRLRPQDRGFFSDTEPSEAKTLTSALNELKGDTSNSQQLAVKVVDGYKMLQELLLETSPLGRAILLIDPPYEDALGDFASVSHVIDAFLQKIHKY